MQLQPRRVFLCNGVWYLVAHDNKDAQDKLYRLFRFQNIRVLDKATTIDPHFSLREYLGNAWTVSRGKRDYHIEIAFDAEAAPLIEERHWHHTQELEKRADGSLLFRATVSGLEEIKFWVLQWGSRATVLKPKELVDEVQGLAGQIMDKYGCQDGGRRKSPKE